MPAPRMRWNQTSGSSRPSTRRAPRPNARRTRPSRPKSEAAHALPPAYRFDRAVREEEAHDEKGHEVDNVLGVDEALQQLLEVVGDRHVLDERAPGPLHGLAEPADRVQHEQREEGADVG